MNTSKLFTCSAPFGISLPLVSPAVVALWLAPAVTWADPVVDALAAAKVTGNVRLRYETVEDDAVNRDAEGLTLRTRLGMETGKVAGFSVVAEFEDIRTLFGMDEYAPETAGYPVIADPAETEVNRAYVRYTGIEQLDLGLGRQRIILDNARFVGNVGWRQDEQTFDAFTLNYTGLADVAVSYAYLDQVNGITPAFDADVDDHLFNIAYTGFGVGKVVAYGYLLDNQETGATYDTYGARLDGGVPLAGVKLLYVLEYAAQEAEQGGADFNADYWLAEVGAGFTLAGLPATVKAGMEVLESDDAQYGFQTPYATKHAFNGWADKFLVTPVTGLEDRYVAVGIDLPAAVKALAVYHRFEVNETSADFGSEWNLQVTKAIGKHYMVGAKYAAYSAEDGPYRDTDKLWLWGELSF